MQLYAKLHKKDHSKAQGLFAAPSEVNAAIEVSRTFVGTPYVAENGSLQNIYMLIAGDVARAITIYQQI